MMPFARFPFVAQNVVYIVTNTIMHFRTFNLETMDNTTGAFGLGDASIKQPPLSPPQRGVDSSV
jgi:hypothetical protein